MIESCFDICNEKMLLYYRHIEEHKAFFKKDLEATQIKLYFENWHMHFKNKQDKNKPSW